MARTAVQGESRLTSRPRAQERAPALQSVPIRRRSRRRTAVHKVPGTRPNAPSEPRRGPCDSVPKGTSSRDIFGWPTVASKGWEARRLCAPVPVIPRTLTQPAIASKANGLGVFGRTQRPWLRWCQVPDWHFSGDRVHPTRGDRRRTARLGRGVAHARHEPNTNACAPAGAPRPGRPNGVWPGAGWWQVGWRPPARPGSLHRARPS